MDKTILVIGGTGTLGRPVAHSLKGAGFQVRVMTRDPDKSRRIFDDTFEIFTGDPMDRQSLEAALNGCMGAHISLPNGIEQQVAENVSKIVGSDGHVRISYISGATVSEENCWFPMIQRKFLAEKAIVERGIPYTILCPSWVMESLPMFVNQGRAMVLGKQPHPYHWVAAEDIARMVAEAYRMDGHGSGRFIVYGPEAIQMDQALRRYCAAFQPEIKAISRMPFWMVRLLATLTGNQGLKEAGEMMAYFEKVGEGGHSPVNNEVLSRPLTTLDEWIVARKKGLNHTNR